MTPSQQTTQTGSVQDQGKLRLWLADRIQSSLPDNLHLERDPKVIQLIRERFNAATQHAKINLPAGREEAFFKEVLDEILGYGPIESLLQDDSITEIMINGPDQIYVEKKGKLTEADVHFIDNDHILKVINKIIKPLSRHVDRESPMVDGRLPDGSRVNAIIAPCAVDGPIVTIRKFSKQRFTMDDLINFGSLNEPMANYLEACVRSKLNILIAGGTGSGKTTFLNVLSNFIPDEERIITIEDAAELSLSQRHVVRLETKHAANPGETDVSIRRLVINALRMRPERIVVGECRGGEALDMLQAMNTGHDGSMTTIHANTPRDTLARLETLVLMAGMDLPLSVVRRQIASAINLIVQQSRIRDGSRKVVQITEITGMEGDTIVMQDMFKFEERGMEGEQVAGDFNAGGLRSSFDQQFKNHGFNLSATMFSRSAGAEHGGRSRRR
jgi:pilus assembly protein CpaF